MSSTQQSPALLGPSLLTATAADLMTPNPVSIQDDATVEEVIAFLADKGFSAAPVIDEAGHPLGVVSRSDILRYERDRIWRPVSPAPQPEQAPQARDLMTPAVFSAGPDTPAVKLAEQMVELSVHRLFVVDDDGVLIGVVTALDLLRHVCSQAMA